MPPQDPTPLGDAMTHRFPEQKIPQPKRQDENSDSVDAWHDESGAHSADEDAAKDRATGKATGEAKSSHALSDTMTGRPRIPDHAQPSRELDEEAPE